MRGGHAVVQKSLDAPVPPRAMVERAVDGVPGLVRADAATVLRGLHGLVLENTTAETARRLADNLSAAGYECEAVPQASIPVLMPAMAFQRLELPVAFAEPDLALVCRNSLGRTFIHPVSAIVLVAVGWVEIAARTRTEPVRMSPVVAPRFRPFSLPKLEVPPQDRILPAHQILRFEMFSLKQPHRMQATAERLSPFFVGTTALVPHRRETAARELGRLAAGCPGLALNRGYTRLWDAEFIYPSVHAFEEELRWQLWQLKARGSFGVHA